MNEIKICILLLKHRSVERGGCHVYTQKSHVSQHISSSSILLPYPFTHIFYYIVPFHFAWCAQIRVYVWGFFGKAKWGVVHRSHLSMALSHNRLLKICSLEETRSNCAIYDVLLLKNEVNRKCLHVSVWIHLSRSLTFDFREKIDLDDAQYPYHAFIQYLFNPSLDRRFQAVHSDILERTDSREQGREKDSQLHAAFASGRDQSHGERKAWL